MIKNVPPAVLVRFLREHRSEWADYGVDAYAAASLRASPFAVPCARAGGFPSNQVILPLAQTVEHEEVLLKKESNSFINHFLFSLNSFFFQFLEVVRLEGHAYSPEDMGLARDMYLLQVLLHSFTFTYKG